MLRNLLHRLRDYWLARQGTAGMAELIEREMMSEPSDTDGTCSICGAVMEIPFGMEPTEICGSCAHSEVDRLTSEAADLRAQLAATQGYLDAAREAIGLAQFSSEPLSATIIDLRAQLANSQAELQVTAGALALCAQEKAPYMQRAERAETALAQVSAENAQYRHIFAAGSEDVVAELHAVRDEMAGLKETACAAESDLADARSGIVEANKRWTEAREALAEAKADGELLDECLVTLKHAEVFIGSRERMHPDGQKLYRELIDSLAARAKGQNNDR